MLKGMSTLCSPPLSHTYVALFVFRHLSRSGLPLPFTTLAFSPPSLLLPLWLVRACVFRLKVMGSERGGWGYTCDLITARSLTVF